MKRIGVVLILFLGACATLFAFRAPGTRSLPEFDKRSGLHPVAPEIATEKKAAADRLQRLSPDVRISFDSIRHSPSHIASPSDFLSGPGGRGKAVSIAAADSVAATDSHYPIKAFLTEHAPLFGHGPEVLTAARVERDFTTPHNGLRTTVWQQRVDDIDIFEGVLMGHVTAKGELVAISSGFLAEPDRAADKGLPGRRAKQQQPVISAKQALSLAAAAINEDVLPESFIASNEQPSGAEKLQHFTASPVLNQCRVRLVWLPLNDSEMRLCWLVRLVSQKLGEGFHVLIDADSGELMLRRCLTVYLSNATYNVFTSDSPSPFSPGLQTPGPFQPALIPRTLVTTSALDTNASPLGWIADGDNETRGNNVDAHLDRDRDDQPDLPRPQGNPQRVFDFPMNPALDPTSYSSAAVVSLFYWCNWMHDQLYSLGFTEAAGNLQNNNFSRGGRGNDAIEADAQDGSGFNNANLTPDTDGFPCRIQMYIFDGPVPHRDGDFDAEVMLHEYTHAVSERLVGGGVLISALQTAGMGEGWSDFYGLSLLSEPTDDVDAAYAAGGYASYSLGGLTQNYYYGIRRYPYCTDLSKNPLTFKDIDPGQASAHTGVPLSPIYSPFSPSSADEVHFQGEVWCVTLWEARANLIKKWGYAVGNRLILQLVTDGMKLGPANPNFLQARDAIIQADQVNNNGANYNELWAAFAKRGMGGSASSPPSSTTVGVVEAFDAPGLALQSTSVRDTLTGNANGIIDVDECFELSVILRNNGRRIATNIVTTLSSITPGVTVSQGDSTYPSIPVRAVGTNLVPFRLFVASTFSCGSLIDLLLTVRSEQDTRNIKIRLKTGATGSAVRFDSTGPVAIPDADLRGVDSRITVSDFPSAVSKVTLSLYATHTWDSDLTFELISPDGTKVLLSSHNGFNRDNYGASCSPDSQRTTFDDNAPVSILSGTAPFIGTFRPQQFLSSFEGKAPSVVNGTWRLHVVDDAFADIGRIECWSLFLSPSICSRGNGPCATDVSIAVSVSPNPPVVGSNITYSIVATNRGGIPAAGVYVTNVLPAGIQHVSSFSSRGSCSETNGIVTCSIGVLPPNTSTTISIQGHPVVSGPVTNFAAITSITADANPSNNTNTLVTIIPAPTPVIVATGVRLVSEDLSPPNGSIDPGETVTLNFFLQNIGSGPASNLVATLLTTPGVAPVVASQTYGLVPVSSTSVSRPFSFKATAAEGETISPTLSLRDGNRDFGTVSFDFALRASFSFSNPNAITIPDSAARPALTYPSTIFVSGVGGTVGRVTVTLKNVQHSFASDLDILLVSPNGRSVLLMSDVGGGTPLNNVTLTFDDLAPALPEGDVISTGSYRPTDIDTGDGDLFPAPAPAAPYGASLSTFNGGNVNGSWKLYVFDDTPGDGGRIAGGWRLDIQTIDPVDPSADLAISGSASPPSVTASSNVVYTLAVLNQGPDIATDVLLTSQLPPGAQFVSADSGLGGCDVVGETVSCYLGTLFPQEQINVAVEAAPTRSGTATNMITVASNEHDSNLSDNTLRLRTTVTAATDLTLLFEPTPNPAIINQPLALAVIATNMGPNSASGVVVTNKLPPGQIVSSITPSLGTFSSANGVITWNVGSLASHSAAALVIQLRPAVFGSLTNTAQVKAAQPIELNPSNNSATLVLDVSDGPVILRPAGAVLVSESFAPPSGGIDPGERVTVSLALRNIGISNATSVSATLLNSNGVVPVTSSQVYGPILSLGAPVTRSFTFDANGPAGSTISALLNLTDGSSSLGQVAFPFVLGGSRRFANQAIINVQDGTNAAPYPSTITVAGLTGALAHVSVTLSNLNHDFPGDIDVLLVSPAGRSVVLMSDAGGQTPVSGVTLSFTDAATQPLPDSAKLVSGLFRPTDYPPADLFPGPAPEPPYANDLTAVLGDNPNGVWSLFVLDDEISDQGQIGGWSLSLSTVGRLPTAPVINFVTIRAGACELTISGQPGDQIVIEASTDLISWTVVGTRSLTATSTTFSDSLVSGHKFYRVGRQL